MPGALQMALIIISMTTYLVDITIPILQTRKKDQRGSVNWPKSHLNWGHFAGNTHMVFPQNSILLSFTTTNVITTSKNNLLSYYKNKRIKRTKPKGVAWDDAFPLHYLRNMTNSKVSIEHITCSTVSTIKKEEI